MTDQQEELSFSEKLAQAKPVEDTVDICLAGELVAEYNALQQQLAATSDAPPGSGSLAGNSAKRDLQQQLEAVAAAMRRRTQTFRLRALGDTAYSKFLAGHPPRPEDRRDMLCGYNRETMGPALIRACVIEPKVTDAQWDELGVVVSPGEWSKLDKLATSLNFSEISIPF